MDDYAHLAWCEQVRRAIVQARLQLDEANMELTMDAYPDQEEVWEAIQRAVDHLLPVINQVRTLTPHG